ncbi:MarR family winged helix-turn-helix transcriptional regulator [Luteimonas sp. RD2P54]|uniref:MarR family winged helix-turn-helix transcriptional regulator n=1 Tax=Luteimonas endophytica TaxID=3042023 RepID=A0ABT6J4F9_9GAMM|nr:MarR family winged helix-turn-helix transcriptional regulator [Luteimonas endophytica]MDH5821711.1 MarR family winged helix-turn-helix transcriptional regulator [Luteimonas endophytica]
MPKPESSPLQAFRNSRGYRASALLKRLHVGLTVLMEERLREHGIELTRPQALTLMHLSECPGKSNAELARMSAVSPQTMHQILLRLGRDGLVTRAPHPWLGRVMTVRITDKGRDLITRGGAVAQGVIDGALGVLSATEQEQLVGLLERCVATLPTTLLKPD